MCMYTSFFTFSSRTYGLFTSFRNVKGLFRGNISTGMCQMRKNPSHSWPLFRTFVQLELERFLECLASSLRQRNCVDSGSDTFKHLIVTCIYILSRIIINLYKYIKSYSSYVISTCSITYSTISNYNYNIVNILIFVLCSFFIMLKLKQVLIRIM